MCDACVMDRVKASMLSRRGLLGLGAAIGASSLVATRASVAQETEPPAAPEAVLTESTQRVTVSEITDLTHELFPDFPTYFGVPGFAMAKSFEFGKDGFNLFELSINEHTGTHIDAPLHFSADGLAVNEIPVAKLMAPLVVIDIKEKAAANSDAQVTPDDLAAWIAANGEFPANCCIAMNSGWSQHLLTEKYRNTDDAKTMHFPGFHVEAMQMLVEKSTAVGVAVDTLSLDFGKSPDFAAHKAWLPSGRWGIECIAGLDDVPEIGATILVGAPKHRGGTGGPARVFALS